MTATATATSSNRRRRKHHRRGVMWLGAFRRGAIILPLMLAISTISSRTTTTTKLTSSASPASSSSTDADGAIISACSSILPFMVHSFVLQHPTLKWGVKSSILKTERRHASSSAVIVLAAGSSKKKKVKKKRSGSSTSGFGGAALESCPCGTGLSYSKCCGRIHSDLNEFRQATPSEVVRARYSAYARRDADFLMASTHPSHKDYQSTSEKRSAWKEMIKTNMYDNFDFSNCVIVKETIVSDAEGQVQDDDSEHEQQKAIVQFIAEMTLKATGEKTSFMETSTFERSSGGGGTWLYREGTIEAAPKSPSTRGTTTSPPTDQNPSDPLPATLLEGLRSST